ncbi:MAG: 4Fe-4S cluster-binding domain-containing protein, partial [Victivallaceae bacterium]
MAKLKVSRIKDCSLVLGPGRRAIIWFGGCSKNCPNCLAASSINHDLKFVEFSAVELCQRMMQITEQLEGITLSGGEPFEQDLTELAEFLHLVKMAKSDWSIMCYSGKYLTEIQRQNDA